jgi:hypothetical protein
VAVKAAQKRGAGEDQGGEGKRGKPTEKATESRGKKGGGEDNA